MKQRLMIVCDAYFPGELGGGGMWAVYNLASHFSNRYDFFIVTRDCDGRIDNTPYVKIPRNKWTLREEAEVYYASPSDLIPKRFAELVEEIKPDAIYLNSVMSRPCVTFLLAYRFYLKRGVPLVIAPCGEFSRAALRLGALKKRCFLRAAKILGLFRGAIWKAASDAERREIQLLFPNVTVKVAPELSPKDILPDFSLSEKPVKRSGEMRIVYFSRVTPKKNLGFLLDILSEFRTGSIHLDVIGPTDDADYLGRCKRIAMSLPGNIEVRFLGGLGRSAALEVIKTAHFMALPTQNENYGYVVIESLAAGCPVLLSDQVSWDAVEENGAGWLKPLSESGWKELLNRCLWMDDKEFRRMSFCAREFAVKYLIAEEPTTVNQLMFDSVLTAR